MLEPYQEKLMEWLPMAISPWSLFASSLTLVSIARVTDATQRNTVYHRLLAGISTCDVFLSLFYIAGPLPIPQEFGGKGNWITCGIQGAFYQFGTSEFFYAAGLAIYYVLVIRYNLKERILTYYFEPVVHTVALGYVLTTVLMASFNQMFNPLPAFNVCVISAHPHLCEVDPDTECTRGPSNTSDYIRWFFMVPVMSILVTVQTALAVVVLTVWQRHRKHAQFRFWTRQSTTNSSRRIQPHQQLKTVIVQCLLYNANLINGLLWSSILAYMIVTDQSDRNYADLVWVSIMSRAMLPLYGVLNFFIFVRPRFTRHGRLWAFQRAVWHPSQNLRRGCPCCGPSPSLQLEHQGGGMSSQLSIPMHVPTQTFPPPAGLNDDSIEREQQSPDNTPKTQFPQSDLTVANEGP